MLRISFISDFHGIRSAGQKADLSLQTSYVTHQARENIHSGETEEPQMFARCPGLFQLCCRNSFVCVKFRLFRL